MSGLSDACTTLAELLPIAQALTTEPDIDGTTGHGKPGSRPPWNPAAANAVLDVHAGVRHIELTMRIEAGLPVRLRGGSDASTMAAIAAIEALSSSDVSDAAIADARRHLERLIRPIEEHPAIDTAEPWRRVYGVNCPYCGIGMLRLARRAGRVTCLRYGACTDRDGNHPTGLVQQSAFGQPMVAWADGFIQYGAIDDGQAAP